MPGMWMSSSSTCAPLAGSRSIVSMPWRASPTTLVGSSAAMSPSSVFRRSRAGSSSSAMKTLSSGIAVRYLDFDAIASAGGRGGDACLGVEEKLQALADVLERHAVAGALHLGLDERVLDAREDPGAAPLDAHQHVAGAGPRLHAVVHGVLEQGLEHERRQQGIGGRGVELPADAQPLAKAPLLERGIALEQRDLVGEAHELARVRHQGAEEIRQVLERALGALRIAPDQRQHRVQAVEQEVRPDARLQRLQARLGQRRRVRLDEEAKVHQQAGGHQHAEQQQSRQRGAQRRLGHLGDQARVEPDQRHHHREHCRAAGPVRQPAKRARQRDQHHDDQEQQRLEKRRRLHEALERLRKARHRKQRGGEVRRVHRDQDARDDAEVAEVGQGVRIGLLPYTDHGYEGVFNRILMPRKRPTWSARFSAPVDERVKRFTASVAFDRRLAKYDIRASLAHARMLAARRILGRRDLAAVQRGLRKISKEVEAGRFRWSLDAEDVHLNIERRLIALVGDAGKRLHTARSRNDQVATDVRLWLRDEIDGLRTLLSRLEVVLLDQAERHAALVMPGFTHLQVAQPVTFGHHLMAYVEMLERDRERLLELRKRVNRLPLGAAALAGTSFLIDRNRVARELGFEGLCENSLDAVSDRDFAIEFCAAASILMVHLSRFAEELVLWASPRFGFVRLPDGYCTGSSIMPQKKNPDVPELVRGKSGRVFGHLVALLALMKAQPLAYNKDNQEDKEPLFDTADTVRDCTAVFAGLVAGLEPLAGPMRAAALEGHATATDLADYLVRKGLPFRDAHGVVAAAVREAERRGVDLASLPVSTLKKFSPKIGPDVKQVLTLEGSVAARRHAGGTAPAEVRRAVARARKRLNR